MEQLPGKDQRAVDDLMKPQTVTEQIEDMSETVHMVPEYKDEKGDTFSLKDQDLKKEVPAYVSIRKMDDTVENLLSGLKLQVENKGAKDITEDDTTVGDSQYAAKIVSYTSGRRQREIYDFRCRI